MLRRNIKIKYKQQTNRGGNGVTSFFLNTETIKHVTT